MKFRAEIPTGGINVEGDDSVDTTFTIVTVEYTYYAGTDRHTTSASQEPNDTEDLSINRVTDDDGAIFDLKPEHLLEIESLAWMDVDKMKNGSRHE